MASISEKSINSKNSKNSKKTVKTPNPSSSRTLCRGIEAFAHGIIQGGLEYLFVHHLESIQAMTHLFAEQLTQKGGKLIQCESEFSAIHMLYGASAGGGMGLTITDSPGFSKIQEGLSYLAGADLPGVIFNIMRSGPGTGNLSPAQGEYSSAVRGGGHGDFHSIVLSPASVGDMFECGLNALHLSTKYQIPVIILADGAIAHMMEPVQMAEYSTPKLFPLKTPLNGCLNRPRKHITTMEMNEINLEIKVLERAEGYRKAISELQTGTRIKNSFFTQETEGCEILIIAHGILSRVAQTAVEKSRKRGLKVGLFAPKMLWPFPAEPLKQAAKTARMILVPELNMGQMVHDIRRFIPHHIKVHSYNRGGGRIPSSFEMLNILKSLLDQK